MKSVMFTEGNEFIAEFTSRPEIIDSHLIKNLAAMLDSKELKVLCERIDLRNGLWDGEMLIMFARVPKSQDVINRIIQWAGADEIYMATKKELRLWWD